VPIKENDSDLLNRNYSRIGGLKLSQIIYDRSEQWITDLKRIRNLAPGTIRHHVGAIARCFDWGLKKGYLITNPLRSLPKGFVNYSEQDKRYVKVKEDQERDRRLEPGEEESIRRVLTMQVVAI
jgi:hypothetical protein